MVVGRFITQHVREWTKRENKIYLTARASFVYRSH